MLKHVCWILTTLVLTTLSCSPLEVDNQTQAVTSFCPDHPPLRCWPSNLPDEDRRCTVSCQASAGGGDQAYCPEFTPKEVFDCDNQCAPLGRNTTAWALCTLSCLNQISHLCVGGERP